MTFQKSIHSLMFAFGLAITTSGVLHGFCNSLIIPLSSITSNSFRTGSYKEWGNLLQYSLTMLSEGVIILCCTSLALPSSFIKMSLKSLINCFIWSQPPLGIHILTTGPALSPLGLEPPPLSPSLGSIPHRSRNPASRLSHFFSRLMWYT